ncbi:hypothetical protein QTV49_004655 [Vibrio vulnificus]|nr:hypothetical protein [Vibrio vulnificus]
MQKSDSINDYLWERCICGGTQILKDGGIDSIYPLTREKTLYNALCKHDDNGCGRVVYGASLKHLNSRWNEGVEDENEKTACMLRTEIEELVSADLAKQE